MNAREIFSMVNNSERSEVPTQNALVRART